MHELFSDFYTVISFFPAGLIDAVVGWGGVIQVLKFFKMLPNTTPEIIFVTRAVAVNFVRMVKLASGAVLPAPGAAFLFAFLSWCLYGYLYSNRSDL